LRFWINPNHNHLGDPPKKTAEINRASNTL